MKTSKIFISLSAVFCVALLFSCTSDIELPPLPPPDSPEEQVSSSSVVQNSSSSFSSSSSSSSGGIGSSSGGGGGGSSSSAAPKCGGIEYNPATEDCCKNSKYTLKRSHYGKEKDQFCDERDGKTYVKVDIGTGTTTKTWMAENLNYRTPDGNSHCHPGNNNTNTSDADNANCNTYGRLYNWATAMAIAASCNTSTVSICGATVSLKHRGICPEGWHIPSNADWNVLMKFVDPSCSDSDNDDCANAGTKLKANSPLWNSDGKGTDDFGFSALPGGIGYSVGNFNNVGYFGYWWSASENGSNYAYSRYMYYDYEGAFWSSNAKSYLRSVRCLQD